MAEGLPARPAGVPPLRTLYVYLTEGCNLACRHCWLTPTFHPNGGTGGHLAYELFEMAIQQAIPLGLTGVKLTGGEPFLHPEIIRLTDLLHAHRLNLTIETNGTLVTPELARTLRERSTLSHISVSLDGSCPQIHDPFRGVPGSFNRAVAGARALVSEGYRPQIIMSLHAGNVDDIEATVRLAEGLGAGSVKFNLVQPCGRGERLESEGETLSIERLVEVGHWVESTLQPRAKIGLHYSWPMAFYRLKRLLESSGGVCGIHTILGLLPAGQFAMCGIGQLIPELCYGSLPGDALSEVWASHPLLLELRQQIPMRLEGVCGRCLMRDSCLGSCAAQNYHQARSLTVPFWFCELAEKAGLFPATRLRPAGSGGCP